MSYCIHLAVKHENDCYLSVVLGKQLPWARKKEALVLALVSSKPRATPIAFTVSAPRGIKYGTPDVIPGTVFENIVESIAEKLHASNQL